MTHDANHIDQIKDFIYELILILTFTQQNQNALEFKSTVGQLSLTQSTIQSVSSLVNIGKL